MPVKKPGLSPAARLRIVGITKRPGTGDVFARDNGCVMCGPSIGRPLPEFIFLLLFCDL
jgi:hypothetical protein